MTVFPSPSNLTAYVNASLLFTSSIALKMTAGVFLLYLTNNNNNNYKDTRETILMKATWAQQRTLDTFMILDR